MLAPPSCSRVCNAIAAFRRSLVYSVNVLMVKTRKTRGMKANCANNFTKAAHPSSSALQLLGTVQNELEAEHVEAVLVVPPRGSAGTVNACLQQNKASQNQLESTSKQLRAAQFEHVRFPESTVGCAPSGLIAGHVCGARTTKATLRNTSQLRYCLPRLDLFPIICASASTV